MILVLRKLTDESAGDADDIFGAVLSAGPPFGFSTVAQAVIINKKLSAYIKCSIVFCLAFTIILFT
ncbi:hypothetical protein DSECCO2_655480 [anaerobic digester metagenome]